METAVPLLRNSTAAAAAAGDTDPAAASSFPAAHNLHTLAAAAAVHSPYFHTSAAADIASAGHLAANARYSWERREIPFRAGSSRAAGPDVQAPWAPEHTERAMRPWRAGADYAAAAFAAAVAAASVQDLQKTETAAQMTEQPEQTSCEE